MYTDIGFNNCFLHLPKLADSFREGMKGNYWRLLNNWFLLVFVMPENSTVLRCH